MLVLHAAWTADDTLALWAEDPELPRHVPRAPGRPKRGARPHPFAAADAALYGQN